MIKISYQTCDTHDLGDGIVRNPDGTIHRDMRHSAWWECKKCSEWMRKEKGKEDA